MKKIITYVLLFLSLFFIIGCTKEVKIKNKTISHETKFGGIYIEITIDDFNKSGFSFGDSVDIIFSNGFKLIDLPYFNGYYTNTGEELLVGYPGYPYIRAGINNGDDLWVKANLKDTDTATIKLNTKAKYLALQEAMDIHYTDIQGDLPDEVFGNFRAVKISNLKENILFRSASPVDNQHKRASVVDKLITDKVNTIINLSDNDGELIEHINKEDFNSPYFLSIYNNHHVIALSMNMNFTSINGEDDNVPKLFTEYVNQTFGEKLILGLRFMIDNDGPYLVHCVEGKDRTGFVCMILEAIVGATYDEIIEDYMITYNNYYGITKEKEPSKYNLIKEKNIDTMLKTVIGNDNVDLKTADYGYYVEQYLINKGMTKEEITVLRNKLSK